MKKILQIIITLISFNLFAAGGVHLDSANTDINDNESLKNGAKLFMNYCVGCHSISFMRYNRISKDLFLNDIVNAYEKAKENMLNSKVLEAQDLVAFSHAFDDKVTGIKQVKKFLAKLSDEEIEDNLIKATDKKIEKDFIFTGEKVGSTITSAMSEADMVNWFGAVPPDLSLTARSRGVDWIYTYLRGFYKDDDGIFGVNNYVLKNASMPDVLWDLKQNKSSEDFDKDVRDITNFLDYVGEPAKLVRTELGYKVLGFLFILLILSYLLKKEYWKDVKYGKWRAKD